MTKAFPEGGDELRSSVGCHCQGESVQPENLSNEELCELFGIDGGLAGQQVALFGESVHHDGD